MCYTLVCCCFFVLCFACFIFLFFVVSGGLLTPAPDIIVGREEEAEPEASAIVAAPNIVDNI